MFVTCASVIFVIIKRLIKMKQTSDFEQFQKSFWWEKLKYLLWNSFWLTRAQLMHSLHYSLKRNVCVSFQVFACD